MIKQQERKIIFKGILVDNIVVDGFLFMDRAFWEPKSNLKA